MAANLSDMRALSALVRRIIPSTIAADIGGIQPMTAPAGQIFSMRYSYNKRPKDVLSFPFDPEHFFITVLTKYKEGDVAWVGEALEFADECGWQAPEIAIIKKSLEASKP